MKKTAIIGTGRLGKKLAALFGHYYPEILWAGRDLVKTSSLAKALGMPSVHPVTVAAALDQADIIIGAIWFDQEKEWVKANREALAHKLYVTVSVPFNESFEDLTLPYGISAAEMIQDNIPDTKVAGAFKTIYWEAFDRTREKGAILPDIYVTANAQNTVDETIAFLSRLPYRAVDAGDLKENRTIERMTLLARKMGRKLGTYPSIGFYLWG